MTIEIVVPPPIKGSSHYEFRCTLKGQAISRSEIRYRLRSIKNGYGSLLHHVVRFGYIANNFHIKHHEIWDSIYPMMFLTRNGGPLFKRHTKAVIRFRYPISAKVSDFFEKRAGNFGMDVRIEGEKFDRTYDLNTAGKILAFGGGKDSRMLLGVLRELGYDPVPVTSGTSAMESGAGNAEDISEAKVATAIGGTLADRIMPSLMMLGSNFYMGAGMGEAHRETPWHQYYDWGSPAELAAFSGLLNELGIKMTCDAPATALPYNLIQKILSNNYPDLAKYQQSVKADSFNEKNLHVALCEMLHGLPYEHHCSSQVFQKLLAKFVRDQVAHPDDFGYHNHREVINREMRAIIHRFKDRPEFVVVKGQVPEDWSGDWIDKIHPYEGMDRSIHSLFKSSIG